MVYKYVDGSGRRKQIGDDNNKQNQWRCVGGDGRAMEVSWKVRL